MPIDFPASPTTGQLYQSGDKTWRYDGEKWTIYATVVVVDSTPIGSLQAYAGTTAPTGWMMAYGQAISRTTFAGLYAVIGTTYGVGDGSTTFNLPDLRGRVPAGLDNMGGSDAGRLSIANTLGTATGAETVTIATSNLPPHTHAIDHDHASFEMTTNNNSQLHTHNYVDRYTYVYTNNVDYGNYYTGYYPTSGTFTTTTENVVHAHSSTIDVPSFSGSSGDGGFANTAINKVQPTIVMNYIIKYGPSAVINGADDQIIIPSQIFR